MLSNLNLFFFAALNAPDFLCNTPRAGKVFFLLTVVYCIPEAHSHTCTQTPVFPDLTSTPCTSSVCSSPLSKSSLRFRLSRPRQSDESTTDQHPGHLIPARPKTGLNFQCLLALVCAFQASLWKLDPQWEVEAGSEAPASAFHALLWL